MICCASHFLFLSSDSRERLPFLTRNSFIHYYISLITKLPIITDRALSIIEFIYSRYLSITAMNFSFADNPSGVGVPSSSFPHHHIAHVAIELILTQILTWITLSKARLLTAVSGSTQSLASRSNSGVVMEETSHRVLLLNCKSGIHYPELQDLPTCTDSTYMILMKPYRCK